MQFNHDFLRKAFVYGGFYGKATAAFPDSGYLMRLDSVDDVFLAVRKAYSDMQPRTFSKIREIDVALWQEYRTEILVSLASRFVEFFSCPFEADSFDAWHLNICTDFLSNLNCKLQLVGYAPVKFGKAQKIVNMSFKYLYCFDSACERLEYFSKAHMALDTYTLDWYKEQVSNTNLPPWSNLELEEYCLIQNDIREHLRQNPFAGARTVFESEFAIWDQYYK